MFCAVAAPEDRAPPAGPVRDLLPSWLLSLVAHLSLVLLLALLQVAGDGGWRDVRVVLDCYSAGADEPGDDALAATIEIPSELTDPPPAGPETPRPAAPAPALDAPQQIELLDPAGNLAALGLAAAAAGEKPGEPARARTEVFGLAAEGQRFVYVFDRSESMNSTLTYTSEGTTVFSITPLEAAKAELLRSLGDLDRHQRFHILFYNHEVWQFDPGGNRQDLVAATHKKRRHAADFVRSVYGYGNTRHVAPLELALRMRPDVIFLLTDGEAKDDPSEAELARLTRLNHRRAKINVIQFCLAPRTGSTLVRLARENDGRHIFMNIRQLAPGMAEMTR